MAKRRGGIWKVGLGLLTALAVLVPAGTASAATCNADGVCGVDFSVRVDVEFDRKIGTSPFAQNGTTPVDWGDSSAVDQATLSGFDIFGTHTYKSPGVYTVTIDGGDAGDSTAQATVMPKLCGGRAPTIYRGSGHAGTGGANGTPMDLTGTPGADVIVGDSGRDTLRGGGGNDTICGAAGSDTIYDNDGADKVFGQGAKDVLYAGHGADTYSGGDGFDVVSYRLRHTPVFASLDGTLGSGALDEGDNIAADVDGLTGGPKDDILTGDAGPNELKGGAGSDSVKGLAGNDTLSDGPGDDTGAEGGDDNDTLIAGTGSDVMDGGAGRDHVTYAGRSDGVKAAIGQAATPTYEDVVDASVEKLSGSQGGDTLEGSERADTIYGEAGVDTIRGFAGDDTLLDGPGNDQVHGGADNDTFYSEAGADQFDGDDGTADLVSYRFRTAPVTASMGVPGASGTAFPAEGDSIGGTVEWLGGGSGNDNLNGSNASADVIFGNGGDDNINGNAGNDRVYGNAGADTLLDGLGADFLFGGDGDDDLTMSADSEVDTAYCGDGASDSAVKGDADDRAGAACEAISP